MRRTRAAAAAAARLLAHAPSSACSLRAAHGLAGAASSAADTRAALEYCASHVRRHDYDGYVCSLALPARVRPAALALRAFNVETALVLDSAKETPLALMRLRWWRDAVEAAGARAPPPHPVARALAATLPAAEAASKKVCALLERIVVCREGDAALAGLPPGLEALSVYAEGTSGSLLRALLHAAGAHSRAADVAAGCAGTAAGLAALLAGARAHLARGRVYLPEDALRREGVTPDALRTQGGGPGARTVVAQVAAEAQRQLQMARDTRDALEPLARRVLLPAVPVRLYLEALQAAQHDAFADSLARAGGVVSPTRLQLAVAWAAMRGRY